MKYIQKLVGNRCFLSPLMIEDARQYTEWLNNLEVIRYLTLASQSISLHQEEDMLKELAKQHTYGIVTLEDEQLIGNCGAFAVDHMRRTCEVGIFIGNQEYWGKGYGSEALGLLAGYLFDYLNMHSIFLRVYSFNKRAIRSYEKLGFRIVGTRREVVPREGAWHDEVLMDLLEDEFRSRQ